MNITGAIAEAIVKDTKIPDIIHGSFEGIFDDNVLAGVLAWIEQTDQDKLREFFTPVPLGSALQATNACVISLSPMELNPILKNANDSPTTYGNSWMEIRASGNGGFVSSPQNSDSDAAQLALWLPVRQGSGEVRLVPLDFGRRIGDPTDPETPPESPPGLLGAPQCDVGFAQAGDQVTSVCLPSECPRSCGGLWKFIKGEVILVGCECHS